MIKPAPPKRVLQFLRWFCREDFLEEIEGDLTEVFQKQYESSPRKAEWKFAWNVIKYFRPKFMKSYKNHQPNAYDMYKSYFKIGWRNLRSNGSFSFINISGLAMGMTACALIMLYVLDEMSYDKHYADGQRVYRIASEVKGEKWVAAPAPLADGLITEFPEVEQVTRLLRFPGAETMLLQDDLLKKQFFETNAYYVDSTFFQLFNYDFKFGDIHTALNEPNSLVISEEVATKFFGNENPVNNVLKVGLSFGDFNYTIKGVFRNTNTKSHIPARLLLSMNNRDVGGWVKGQTRWASNSIFHTYVKLKEGSQPEIFESKLTEFLKMKGGDEFKEAGFTKQLFIQPLEDIYLHSDYGYEVASNGNIKYLYIFTSIAAFLLLIACINFMNLSTARSEKRAREVGLRKVVGAGKGMLVGQFLTESLIMSGLALVFTLLLLQLSLPLFNQLTRKELALLDVPNVAAGLIALTLLTGLISGLYPAFYLSSFKPVATIKGKLLNTLSAVAIRKGLVIFQFTISIVLILGTIVITQQMTYLSNRNLGFDKNQKIILPIQTNEAQKNTIALTNELSNNAQVSSLAIGGAYPGIESITSMLFYGEGKTIKDKGEIQTVYAASGYIKTLGIELLNGRELSQDAPTDQGALVVNESAVRQLGYTVDNALGQKAYFEFNNETKSMTIVGVVKDYHFQSLQQKIKPLALTVSPFFSGPTSYLIVNVTSTEYSQLIQQFQDAWNKVNSNSPFNYSFLDQDFQRNYLKEERTLQLIRYFTIIAIVIACMGLFGLATFTAEQRIKEMGVRKVLGASVAQLVTLMSKDFLKLVAISLVLSSPIAYYVMSTWLQDFAYRIDIQWWVFVLAGLSAVAIAMFTVGYQAIKAALVNPVKNLRSE
jgi:putative ABC transport system permease protein